MLVVPTSGFRVRGYVYTAGFSLKWELGYLIWVLIIRILLFGVLY